MLWAHAAKRERRLVVDPDSEGRLKAAWGKVTQDDLKEKAASVWGTATRTHYNRDLRFNSQSLIVAMTDRPCIGGRAWPSVIFENREHEYAFALWSDSTLGLEAILYEFAGCPKYIGRHEIESRFKSASVDQSHYDFYLDLLCDVNFLALASNDGYQYAKHEADREIKRKIAEQMARNASLEESYQVSSAFWRVLQIDQSTAEQ